MTYGTEQQNRLNEIKAREAAATPGPWVADAKPAKKRVSIYSKSQLFSASAYAGTPPPDWKPKYEKMSFQFHNDNLTPDNWHQAKFDSWFIANARADIPWLIAEVERLRAENERLKRER